MLERVWGASPAGPGLCVSKLPYIINFNNMEIAQLSQYPNYAAGYAGGVNGAPTNFFSPSNILIGVCAFILIFLLVREILCWYWKINKIVRLLEDIKSNTSAARTISVIPQIKIDKPLAQNQMPSAAIQEVVNKNSVSDFF